MLNLSLKVLKLIAKNRSIKGYKRMSKNKLINSLKASKPIKKTINTIKDIRKNNSNADEILESIRNVFKQEKDKSIKEEY